MSEKQLDYKYQTPLFVVWASLQTKTLAQVVITKVLWSLRRLQKKTQLGKIQVGMRILQTRTSKLSASFLLVGSMISPQLSP